MSELMQAEMKKQGQKWPKGTVADIAEVISGYAFKSEWFEEGDDKIIRIGDLKNGRIDVLNAATFSSQVNPIKDQFRIKSGDILMALSGATVGKIAIADLSVEGCYLNQRVAIIRGKCQENSDFLKYVFSGTSLQTLLLKAGGAAQPNLSPKDLSNMQIPLPPLEEQKRIAAILDKADAIRRKRQQAIKLADEFLRSVFLDMFGDPVTNGWDWTTVEELADSTKGSMRTGPFGSDLKHSEFVDSGVAVLGIDNAVRNRFVWGKERFITSEKYEALKRYTVKSGDVIITIMGTCGRCAVVPNDIPLAVNTKHLCCITLDKNKCLPEFLHSYFLIHPAANRYLGARAKGAIMDGLNLGMIKELPIPVVPIAHQAKYVDLSKLVNSSLEKLNLSKIDQNCLFSALSQKAFSSEF